MAHVLPARFAKKRVMDRARIELADAAQAQKYVTIEAEALTDELRKMGLTEETLDYLAEIARGPGAARRTIRGRALRFRGARATRSRGASGASSSARST